MAEGVTEFYKVMMKNGVPEDPVVVIAFCVVMMYETVASQILGSADLTGTA